MANEAPTYNKYKYMYEISGDSTFSNDIPSIGSAVWYFGITQEDPTEGQTDLFPTDYVFNVSLGCSRYLECDTCVRDPNCGWCSSVGTGDLSWFSWRQVASAETLPGNCIQGGLNNHNSYCVSWSYTTCALFLVENSEKIQGITYGTATGFALSLIMGIVIFIYYRQTKIRESERMRLRFSHNSTRLDYDNLLRRDGSYGPADILTIQQSIKRDNLNNESDSEDGFIARIQYKK
jgi:hypothetical protein